MKDVGGAPRDGDLPDSVSRNIDAVTEFYEREEKKISAPRDFIERTSSLAGRPVYLACLSVFIALWIGANVPQRLGLPWQPFDPPPFTWLQGIVSLYALLVGTAVLIRQERMGRLAEQRAHLDLQVNLLTETKVAKVIEMLEALRQDLPNVGSRHDPEARAMQTPASAHAVLSALETQVAPGERKPE